MSRRELEDLFNYSNEKNKTLYIMNLNGSFYDSADSLFLPSEEKIAEWTKKKLEGELRLYKESVAKGNVYTYFSNDTLKYFQYSIDNLNIENLPSDLWFTDDNIIMIKTDGTNIFVQLVSIRFMKHDYYKVEISKMPVFKYTLEQLKYLTPKILETKEPKIVSRLNPGVSKEDIKINKKLVKSLK